MSATGTCSLLGSLAAIFVLTGLSSETSEYCVVSSPANDSATSSGCRILDEYVENKDHYNWSDAMFLFQEGIHNHSQGLILTNETNLVLTGVAEDRVTITCYNNTNFIFINVVELTIANLTFVSCGQLFVRNNITSAAALTFFHGHTLTVERVTVDSAPYGAVHTESVFGDIVVSECRFVNSHVEDSQHLGGSRFIFSNHSHSVFGHPKSRLLISQTYFTNNTMASLSKTNCTHKGGILSGGAVILIMCPNVSATLDGVRFENNLGCFGGALTLIMGTSSILTNRVNISNSLFRSNAGWYGGGIIMDVYYYHPCIRGAQWKKRMPMIIEISHSNFTNNSAEWTGGALYIRHKESNLMCTAGSIMIADCTFRRNWLKSYGGVAIFNINYIAYSVLPHTVPQYYLTLERCLLEDNYVSNNVWNNSGSGVIVTKSNPHINITDTTIIHNKCSGLVAITSNVIFNKEVNITDNSGSSGGGLLLCSGAILYFDYNAVLTIARNSVRHVGGGILVEYDCRQAKPICFFQHLPHHRNHKQGPVVYLHDNTANYSGHNLYGGSVDYCTILSSPHNKNTSPHSSDIFPTLFPHHTRYNDTTITSAPTRACFCDKDDKPNCEKDYQLVRTPPGGTIKTQVVLVGQWNSPSPGTMGANIKGKGIRFPHGNFKVFDIRDRCQSIELTVQNTSHKEIKQNGSHAIELYVTTSSDISFTEHLSNFKSIYIHVTLGNCPFGFNINDKADECNCHYLKHHCVSCNSSKKSWHFDKAGHTWLGSHEMHGVRYLAVADNCPPAFCKHIGTITSDDTSLVNPNRQCRPNRTGVLCGDCAPGYSLILGGDDCTKDCSNTRLSLIIMFIVLGMLLIFFLTIFDLTVAEGTIGGILFYANVFQINSDLYLQTDKYKNTAAVCKTFIAWLNLDFGIPTCFYKGMNSYDKALLQYAFPLYIWLLAGGIIFISKKNAKIAALFRTNCVKVLSTLILLSYAKLARLTMHILRYHRIYLFRIDGSDLENPSLKHTHHKWAYDGKMDYFTKREHLPLFIAGVLTVAVLAPYTLCLLFIRTLYQNSSHRALWWINKWRPFFDTYVGPYTNAGYCWTGLQLLARFVVLMANEAQSKELDSILITLAVVAVLFVAAWWAESRIYKKRGHNILEGVSLLNLVFLQLATASTLGSVHYRNTIRYTFVSVILTMALFMGVVCYHGYRQLFSLAYFKARTSGVKNWISNNAQPDAELNEDDNRVPSGQLPSVVGLPDREPLLAEDD